MSHIISGSHENIIQREGRMDGGRPKCTVHQKEKDSACYLSGLGLIIIKDWVLKCIEFTFLQ